MTVPVMGCDKSHTFSILEIKKTKEEKRSDGRGNAILTFRRGKTEYVKKKKYLSPENVHMWGRKGGGVPGRAGAV